MTLNRKAFSDVRVDNKWKMPYRKLHINELHGLELIALDAVYANGMIVMSTYGFIYIKCMVLPYKLSQQVAVWCVLCMHFVSFHYFLRRFLF